jgi:hypothetical protein
MRVKSPSRYVRSRQDWILGQMRGLGGVSLLYQIEPPAAKSQKKKKKT